MDKDKNKIMDFYDAMVSAPYSEGLVIHAFTSHCLLLDSREKKFSEIGVTDLIFELKQRARVASTVILVDDRYRVKVGEKRPTKILKDKYA